MNHQIRLITLLFLALSLGQARAAFNVYLELQINGSAVDGEPTTTVMGGTDVSSMIECVATEHEIFRPGAAGAGLTHGAFKFVKRIDAATPLLAGGLISTTAGSAVFHFFGRDPDSGQVEETFQITLTGVRVVSQRTWNPNTLDPASAALPQMEEVQVTYTSIEFSRVDGPSQILTAP